MCVGLRVDVCCCVVIIYVVCVMLGNWIDWYGWLWLGYWCVCYVSVWVFLDCVGSCLGRFVWVFVWFRLC